VRIRDKYSALVAGLCVGRRSLHNSMTTKHNSDVIMKHPLPADIELKAMHAEIRTNVMSRLPKVQGHIALFQGGRNAYQYDTGKLILFWFLYLTFIETDHEHLFRQESNFHYLFGVNEPNLFGVLDAITEKTYLFIPRFGVEHEVWCGKSKSSSEYSSLYGIDVVCYSDELCSVLKSMEVDTIHILQGVNSDR
jgi:hypothetical protein